MTESEKKEHAITINLARRQLTDDQRKEIWLKLRQQGKTLQKIADIDGTVSRETVRSVCQNLQTDKDTVQRVLSFDKTDIPLTIIGKDGKTYPATKPRKKKTIYVSKETAIKAESLPDPQKEAVLSGNKKIMEAKREVKIEEISKTVNLPDAKYRILCADPPWSYDNTQPDYHIEQRDHYPVKSISDICRMPISDICEDNAVLFLWVTSPILEESFQVINAWGFKYKSSFVWDKVKHNMGHYNSVRHEFLLICTRGSCQPDVRKLFNSVIREERTKHSKKPNCVYEIIETLYPHGKRLELFARGKRKGWDAYGFEA